MTNKLVVYHGTTNDVVEKIEREGLKPNRSNAFDTLREDSFLGMPLGTFENKRTLREEEGNTPLVYVTPNRETAEIFAKFRTDYEKAKQGDILNFNGWMVKKLATLKKADVSPVLLKFELPNSWNKKLKIDPESPTMQGRIYPGIIPAKYLKSVIPLGVSL